MLASEVGPFHVRGGEMKKFWKPSSEFQLGGESSEEMIEVLDEEVEREYDFDENDLVSNVILRFQAISEQSLTVKILSEEEKKK